MMGQRERCVCVCCVCTFTLILKTCCSQRPPPRAPWTLRGLRHSIQLLESAYQAADGMAGTQVLASAEMAHGGAHHIYIYIAASKKALPDEGCIALGASSRGRSSAGCGALPAAHINMQSHKQDERFLFYPVSFSVLPVRASPVPSVGGCPARLTDP